jgi:hypothetical protein
MNVYNQPRLTQSKKDFICSCGKQVQKGETCFFDPKKKQAKCKTCK